MKIAGIDPGISGGIVVLDGEGKIESKNVMPVMTLKGKKTRRVIDIQELADLLSSLDVNMCFLEKVTAMPGNGNVSMFTFGYGCGLLEMGLAAFKVPYTLVPPQTWCKVMHQGISKDIDAKQRSLMVFKRGYPNIDLRASKRCSTVHSGLLDALLIAEYGRRSFVVNQADLKAC